MSTPDVQPASAAAGATFAAAGEKLPLGIKLAYGMPNFAGAAMVIPIGIHMNIFYSDIVGVPLGLIAVGIAVARAFDAITDPLMGWLTDLTKTRWGRRIPWMAVGAPLCAVSFIFLFSPPEMLTGLNAGIWFGATFALYFLFHTMYVIPHYGLGPELTPDYKERSSLFAWMEGFTLVGTMTAAALPGVILIPLYGDREAYTIFAFLFAVILTVLYFWQCYRIKERPEYYQQPANPLVPGMRRVMRNRPARILLASYFVGSITGAIPGLMTPYFVTYVLQPENPAPWIGYYLLAYFASGFLSLPIWLRIVRRFGKKSIFIVSRLLGISGGIMLFFLDKGDMVLSLFVLVYAGLAFGPAIFLGPSIQADVIDYDAFYTGRRREAQYGSLWAFITKFTVIPSAGIPLAIMANMGYVPNVEQPETIRFAISAIYGLAPALFGVLSLLVFLLFPINERTHAAVLEGIEAHKRGETVTDPLTGYPVPPPDDRGIDEETGWFLDHFAPRELRRASRLGAGVIVLGAALASIASLALAVICVALVLPTLPEISTAPKWWTVVLIAIAGVAAAFSLYHVIRVRAALRLRASPVAAEVVAVHLELTRRLGGTRSSAPA